MPADASIFEEALRVAQSRSILPTSLSSAQLRELDSAVRRRAVFSAKLEEARVLEVIKGNVELLASGQRDEWGRVRSKAEMKAQVFEALRAAGVAPAPAGTPAMKDFFSDARLELIASTQFQTTANYGRWLASQDEIALDVNPAWELVRVVAPLSVPRDWGRRWTDAANEVGWQGVAEPGTTGGRLIALKNSPVWKALGDGAGGYEDTLGNPYPPFAFNSGMQTVDVGREECELFGLLAPDEFILPEVLDLNEGLEASVAGLTAADLPGLAEAGLEIVGGILRLMNRRAIRYSAFGNGEWNEEEHPRDDDGQFTDGGSAGADGKESTDKNPLRVEKTPDGFVMKPEQEARRESRQERVKKAREINAAVEKALREKTDIPDAARIPGIGIVDIPYGRPGNPESKREDGYGLSHVEAKHPEDLPRMAETLLDGKVYKHEDAKKRYVVKGEDVAILTQQQFHPRQGGQQPRRSLRRFSLTTFHRAAETASRVASKNQLLNFGPAYPRGGMHPAGRSVTRQVPIGQCRMPKGYAFAPTYAAATNGCRQGLQPATIRRNAQAIFNVLSTFAVAGKEAA